MNAKKELRAAIVLATVVLLLCVCGLTIRRVCPQAANRAMTMLDAEYGQCQECAQIVKLPRWMVLLEPECQVCGGAIEWHYGDEQAKELAWRHPD